jgi:STE24 endopeptidase
MPLSFLFALVIAFGIRLDLVATAPWTASELRERLIQCASLQAAVIAVTMLGAWFLARRLDGGFAWRRRAQRFLRLSDLAVLVVYTVLIHWIDWPRVVEREWTFRGWILVDELLILAPYLVMQVGVWVASYPVHRRLQGSRRLPGRFPRGFWAFLAIKCRQTLGLVLPAAAFYALALDLVQHWWPGYASAPYAQLAGIALMGAFVLILAPIFVRLAWPTRPLEPGPLRDRLERLSRRFGFRFTDILIWDTAGSVVNAGVTGSLPIFRYVLLTDELIASLDEHEIEAVFGHEVGHVANRHLRFFGFFFIGSMGLMGLVAQFLESLTVGLPTWITGIDPMSAGMLLQTTLALAVLGLYFYFVFGGLSRRFERQADVFGCRTVSCDEPGCPRCHVDVNAADVSRPCPATTCEAGVSIFVNALTNVALLNGMEIEGRSWRHGSIGRRVRFLRSLIGRPDRERALGRDVARLRIVLTLILLAGTALAFWSGAIR